MARFQEVILKLAETHPNASFMAASKSILQGRLNQLLSQSHTPDHLPYAAMIERALQELNEELGSSEDSILKFIRKEYNNLPWAHSALLKHHLGKLGESGDIVTIGQRYMLPGAIPSLNSTTGHKKKRKKKWRLNWDWQRERYKPRKKCDSKQKNQQKGDQNEISEDRKESEGLENNASENAIHHEEKPKEEDKGERLLSYNIRKSNNGFDPSLLSPELPRRIDLEGNPQQQEGDKAEGDCPELSSQKPPGFKLASTEPLNRVEFDENKYLKAANQQQQQGDIAEPYCLKLPSQTPPGFEPTRRMEFDENKYLEAIKPQQQEGDKPDDNCPELSSQRPSDESIRIENSMHLGICSEDEFGAQERPIIMEKLHLLALRKLDSAGVTLKLTNKEQLMEHPVTQEPSIFGPLKDKSVGPTGLELGSAKEFCQSLRDGKLPEPKAAATTMGDMELLAFSKLKDQHLLERRLSNLESRRDQHKTPKNSTVVKRSASKAP